MKAVLNPFTAKLQLVPDNKDFVPYSGAVKDLDLGSNGLIVDAGTLFVDKTGHKVGIGTITPSQKLTVAGNIGIKAGTNAYIGTIDNYALSFRTNNVDRVYITNDGNVGIGTINPETKLDVVGSIRTDSTPLSINGIIGKLNSYDTRNSNYLPEQYYRGIVAEFKINSVIGISGEGTYSGILTYRPWGSGTDWTGGGVHQLAFGSSGNIWHRYSQTTGSWGSWSRLLDTANVVKTSSVLQIDGTGNSYIMGNVGIGTASPSQRLTVAGNIGLQAGADAFIGTLDNYGLNLRTNNTDRIIITNDGKIRIGQNTSSLNLLLTVNGGIETTGSFFFTGTTSPFIGTFNNVSLNIGINNRPVIIVTSGNKVTIGATNVLNNATLTVLGSIGAIGNIFISKGEDAFIGTLDNYGLSLRTNNVDRVYIANDGSVGIGVSMNLPSKLTVAGNIGIQAGANAYIGTLDNYGLSLRTNNVDRVYIANDGKVGIGTTPNAKLDIDGQGSDPAVRIRNTGSYPSLQFLPPSNTSNARIWFTRPSDYAHRGSILYDFSNDYMSFRATQVENTLVLKSGNVGIRNTSPSYALQVGIAGDGTSAIANAWNTFSDIRLKEVVGEIKSDEALEKILNLRAKRFYYKNDENKKEYVGFIAQEVEEYIPEVVSTDNTEERYKAIAYEKLIPFLVEAIKEQQKQIEELKQKIEVLEKWTK
jgi:ethanolamine utilization microcompartment shell protein EutS